MVKLVRGPIVANMLCASQRFGDDVFIYVPLDQMSAEMAQALGLILTDALSVPVRAAS